MSSNAESKRIYQIDAIKGLFIFLVVLGHLIGGGYSDNSPLGLTHYFIYSIYMPMFILITGVLSKKEKNLKKVICNYVIPYIIFDFVYVIYGSIIGQPVNWNILVPSFAYWYMLCIAIMKLLYSEIRIEITLTASVVISFLVPLFVPEVAWRWVSIGRVMLLFPVFYVGTLLRGDRLKTLTDHRVKCITFGIIAVLILYLFLWLGVSPVDWATHDYYKTIMQLVIKYFYMLLTVAVFTGLFCIIPESNILQRWGQNFVVIYLLHPFVVPLLRYGVNKITNSDVAVLIIMIISALMITMVLSCDFFKRAYDILIRSVKQVLKLEV